MSPQSRGGGRLQRCQDGTDIAPASQPVAGPSAPSPALRTQVLFRRSSHTLAHTNSAQSVASRGAGLTSPSRPSTADPATTPARSTASYFETYTPYKLNPKLTPSIRDRRDKVRPSKPEHLDTKTPVDARCLAVEAGTARKPPLEAHTSTVHPRAGSNYRSASPSPLEDRTVLSPSSSLSASQSTSSVLNVRAPLETGFDQRGIQNGKAASVEAYRRTAKQSATGDLLMNSDPVQRPSRLQRGARERSLDMPTSDTAARIRPPLAQSLSSPSDSFPSTSRVQRSYDSDSDDQSFDSVTLEAQKMCHPDPQGQERTRKKSLGSAMSAATNIPAKALPLATLPKPLRHAISFPDRRRAHYTSSESPKVPDIPATIYQFAPPQPILSSKGAPSPLPDQLIRESRVSKDSTASRTSATGDGSPTAKEGVQSFVRSSRLTRIITLEDPPHTDLKVSLADVGAPGGHPVFVFLGLGAVRYLVGLYDDLASLLGLRLICVDRWGLGKTDDAPNEKRGLPEWGSIITAVADQLQIDRFSILAHSAGAPFAMATVLQQPNRICGPVHLLAPWVSADFELGYKWLRYVPEQIIRTAQTAEWKLAGWKLGKGDAEAPSASARTTADIDANPGGSGTIVRPEGTRVRCSSAAGGVRSAALAETSAALRSPTGKSPVRAPPTPVKIKTSFLSSIFTPKAGLRRSNGSGEDFFEGSDMEVLSPTMRADEDYLVASRRHQAGTGDEERSRPSTPTGRLIRKYRPRNGSTSQSIHISPADLDFPTSLLRTRDSVLLEAGSHCEDMATQGGPGSHSGKGETWPTRHTASPSKATFPSPTTSVIRSTSSLSAGLPTTGSTSVADDPQPPSTAPAALAQTSPIPTTAASTADLATSLLRASHAESLRGSTPDLLTILGIHSSSSSSSSGPTSSSKRTKPWGFTFSDVSHPLKVWQGDKDERIGLGSAYWLERECMQCELVVVKGAGHGLMTNSKVMLEVLESLASYKDTR
ncbi:hypothetical protein BCV69DRAFT_311913 [Microstroma glucosiphilum]|uniref:Alpha/beta-hydrolase n=1 Tax=Pseudomicrostroma glucosiphilum TaxID=1684307 RepID=A0A316U8B3_9BASI|nr:hypothetical protein BCV69DRAFT_311913 [Pseudomicrostroma glucosiphilum]PWN21402.1 hypothetical protein BCV69DRAFT_311913 [Pseudomicrostroma glucosiphilum]